LEPEWAEERAGGEKGLFSTLLSAYLLRERTPLARSVGRGGNDLLIVWNRGWQKLITRPELSLIPQSDLIAVKLRWTFRF
jgi:hypothetical protein